MLHRAHSTLIVAFVCLFACNIAAAQQAMLLKSLRTGYSSWNFTPTGSDGDVCFLDLTVGPLIGNVHTDVMVSNMEPDMLIRYEKIMYGAFVGPSRIWISGAPLAGGSSESTTIAESTDGGITWSLLDLSRLDGRETYPTETRALLCDYQYDGYTRFDDLFSSDGGDTWSYIPVPDSVVKPDPKKYCYLGQGVWAFFSEGLNYWVELSRVDRSWVKSDIPSDVQAIYALPSGVRIGYKGNAPKQSLVYWSPTERVYRDTIIRISDDMVVDSAWISSFKQVNGGGVVAIVAEGLADNTLITFGESGIHTFSPSLVRDGYAVWSVVSYRGNGTISDENVVYAKLAAAGSKPPIPEALLFYIDVDSGTAREVSKLLLDP